MRLSQRLENEKGFVVLTAIVIMTFMLSVGLALLKVVDSQSKQSKEERVRESAFNAAEGLLYAEAAVLQANWPNKSFNDQLCTANATANTCAYTQQSPGANVPSADPSIPVTCTSANLAGNPANQCPDPSLLFGTDAVTSSNGSTGAFNNTDVTGSSSNVRWSVTVR